MGLARDAANDAIHDSTPRAAIEGGDIAPNSGFSQETFLYRADQLADRECFPLHEHDAASAWHCQLDAEIESSSSGAEADDVDVAGTYSHIQIRLPHAHDKAGTPAERTSNATSNTEV